MFLNNWTSLGGTALLYKEHYVAAATVYIANRIQTALAGVLYCKYNLYNILCSSKASAV